MTKRTLITLLASVAAFGSLTFGALHTAAQTVAPIASPTSEPAAVPEAHPTDLPPPPEQPDQADGVEQPTGVEANGFITGVVKASDTGLPVTSVTVRAYDSAGVQQDTGFPAFSTGVYSLSIPPGTYTVKFDPSISSVYADEWYDNQRDQASATPIVVGDGATTSNINAFLEVGGKITGRVTAAATATPLGSVFVNAYTSTTSTGSAAFAFTNSSGVYTMTGLIEGSYYLEFDPPGSDYLNEYYNDRRSLAAADAVPVTFGGVVSNIDAALDIGGKITGRVTDAATAAPLNNVTVYAYTSTTASSYAAFAATDGSGVYTVTKLSPGAYYLKFDPPFGQDYFEEYYNDKAALATADAVNVSLNTVVSDINAALSAGGKITGRVTADDGGAPLKDVSVGVYGYDECNRLVVVKSATTDASGVYTVTALLTGSYRVKFTPFSSGASAPYLSEFYSDKPALEAADPLAVTQGATTGGIDAGLQRGGQITGRVTAEDGGTPLKDVRVWLYNSTGLSVDTELTDANGVYTITSLIAGNYRLEFEPSSGLSTNYLTEYYSDKPSVATADAVSVAAGGTASGIDAVLNRGGQITGRVTAADTGAPLQGVSILVYSSNNAYVEFALTDANGVYTVTGLRTDAYRVWFGRTEAYFAEYYSNKQSLSTADPVNVTQGSTTNGIDAALDRGAQIAGRVTAADGGAPLADVDVAIYNSDGNYFGLVSTDANGNYATFGLNNGSYRLEFRTRSSSGVTAEYFEEYYNDKASLATADLIAVTVPNVTGDVDAVLARGGKISGRVTAGDTGQPLSGVHVSALDADGLEVRFDRTNASGNYTIVRLPTDGYRVHFHAVRVSVPGVCGPTSKLYLGEYFNDKPDFPTADTVAVTAPNTVTGIDAVLGGGGVVKDVYLPLVRR